MSAVLVLPETVDDREFSSDLALRSAIDLSDLSNEQASAVRTLVGESRLLQRRIGYDQAHLAVRLSKLYDIVGKQRFAPFVQAELDISERTARRYLHVSRVIDAHFRDNQGRLELERVRKVNLKAFGLLSADTDDTVIADIKEIADNGGKVDEEAVKQILSARDVDYEARIASVEANAEAAKTALQSAREQHEAEMFRMSRQMETNSELLRRATAQLEALQEEHDAIKAKPIVEERIVTKEVVPQEYTDVVEAVSAEQRKLSEIQSKRAHTEQQIAELERQRQQLAESQAGAEEILKLREQIESIMLKYPIARMHAITATDQSNKALVESLGTTMIDLGKQLLAGPAK